MVFPVVTPCHARDRMVAFDAAPGKCSPAQESEHVARLFDDAAKMIEGLDWAFCSHGFSTPCRVKLAADRTRDNRD
jgi:hypothetical protein